MSVQRGQTGLDWAGAGLTGTQIVANGALFAMRYSAGVGNASPASQFKLCGPGEIASIIHSGADFIANSEWYESRITEGAAAGRADGLADLAFWRTRGLAKGARIYISWDQYPSTAKYNAVQAYLTAYRQAQGGYYNLQLPGLYAGSAAIREMRRRGVAGAGWQMMSTSFSDNGLPYQPSKAQIAAAVARPPAGIDLWQTGNYWFHNGADEDVALTSSLGSHLQALNGGDTAPMTPAEIAQIFHTDNILPAPPDAYGSPPNKFWSFQTHIYGTTMAVRAIAKIVASLPLRLASLQGQLAEVAAKVDALTAAQQAAVTIPPTDIPVTGTVHFGGTA